MRPSVLAAALLLSLAGLASGQTLARARDRGYLQIGTSGTAAPYSWVDARNELTGYDIDWGNLIGRNLGLPVRWMKIDFRGLMPALSAGQLDLVMSAVRIRPALQDVFLFSAPYSYEATVAITRKEDTTVRSLADIRGRRVAVVAASYQQDVARQIGGYRDMLSLPSGSEVFLALHVGHADVALVGVTAATHYLKVRGDDIRIVEAGSRPNPQGIVINRRGDDLKAAVDRVIAARIADGTAASLYRRHFGADFPRPPE
jgi:ABC-type amino acid transport substrate-binding protein